MDPGKCWGWPWLAAFTSTLMLTRIYFCQRLRSPLGKDSQTHDIGVRSRTGRSYSVVRTLGECPAQRHRHACVQAPAWRRLAPRDRPAKPQRLPAGASRRHPPRFYRAGRADAQTGRQQHLPVRARRRPGRGVAGGAGHPGDLSHAAEMAGQGPPAGWQGRLGEEGAGSLPREERLVRQDEARPQRRGSHSMGRIGKAGDMNGVLRFVIILALLPAALFGVLVLLVAIFTVSGLMP